MPLSSRINTWGYQLQALNVERAANKSHDLLVIDYSLDGSDQRALTPAQVRRLRVKPDGSERIVLAYLSVGEAENYRYYWQKEWAAKPPTWLGKENKSWPGNFIVKFWTDEWREIVLAKGKGYLDKIIEQGFDGVFLDRVDVYEEWRKPKRRSRAQMIDFVVKLSQTAKSRRHGFYVFVQNAEQLLTNKRYRGHIDGIVKEDMLYGYAHDTRLNPKAMRKAHIKHLKLAQRHHLPVLVVEYLSGSPKKRNAAVSKIRKLKFIPYIAERSLTHLLPPQP